MAKGELKDKMTSQEFREYLDRVKAGKESKFKNVPTSTADGQTFQSTLEASYYNRCWVLLKAGEVTLIERQIPYEIFVNGLFITTYIMDFRITYADGHIEYIDTKSSGTMTALYKTKKALMRAVHGIELKEVFEV